ncbi:MAG: radical SAM protein [Phycisphaerae bacterium]|nr:radical SAM protein [Phycisphaerae bacterium]
MELPRRDRGDVYLQDGAFREKIAALRRIAPVSDVTIGIFYAFDFRTHMLPFWYADRRMAPASVRLLGDVLHAAGFVHVRIVLQQWSPRVLPDRMRLDGRPLDILMVSAMQVHAERAYALVRDAYRMGDARPLVLAGGPKAVYEPTDFFELGPEPGVGADCVVTGEVFVLLDLLYTILVGRHAGETPREAYEKARLAGALAKVPGLVYLSPDASPQAPVAVNTGVQRLLRDLDELPLPDAGYRMLEPPHRRRTASAKPAAPERVGRLSTIASVIATQGCRFNCAYCPIPSVNQRTWRHKSPKRFAAEIAHIHEQFGIADFFGTDDNFFNDRQTVIDLMTELARTRIAGKPLSARIRFYTEATEFDVYKNRDLLPLARAGGLAAIWFGIEDITAALVNKGQSAGKTAELFAMLQALEIEPMTMMIHSDTQPLQSRNGDLSGLLDQARYLFDRGAVSYQCTYLGPAVGTRDFEPAARVGTIFKQVGHKDVPQAFQDGNHVVASKHARPWRQQINLLRAYAAFYNPWNTVRAFLKMRGGSLGRKRLLFQCIGQIGLAMSIPRLLAWARQLKRGPIEAYPGLQAARIPMIDAISGEEINWAIEHVPSLSHPSRPSGLPTECYIHGHLLAHGRRDAHRQAGAVVATGMVSR